MVTQANTQVNDWQNGNTSSNDRDEMSSDVKQLRAQVAMLKMEMAQDTHASRQSSGPSSVQSATQRPVRSADGFGSEWMSMLDGRAIGPLPGADEKMGRDDAWREQADRELAQAMRQTLATSHGGMSSIVDSLAAEEPQPSNEVSALESEEAREIAQQQMILESLERQAEALLGENY